MENIQQSPRVNSVDRFGQTQLDQFGYAIGIIDMLAQTSDYKVGSTGVQQSNDIKWFKVIPETSGVMVVELFGSSSDSPTTYTISAAQITAYLGKPLPYAVKRVLKSGTTATFSVAW